MFLKRIDFENFKSFAGKMSIPFMEGYTAITGPNGSGKSNIIDAMMFVMGTKSSKVIRANKLTELIYNGDKAGAKATYTRVTLVFDNTDRMLPFDMDEVRFSRHVKLGGTADKYYSKYYINDNPSSAEEFDSIFLRVRVSSDGYNMVQQGDVADITKMGALERRRIIDGISGIASYDADIQRSMTKKNEASQNIQMTQIVVDELTSQLKQLEKDKEDARKYIEFKDRLDMSKAQLVHRQFEIANATLTSTQETIAKLDKDIEKQESIKSQAIIQIDEYTKFYAEVEKQIEDSLGQEYIDVKNEIEQKKIDKGVNEERVNSLKEANQEMEEAIAADKEALEEEKKLLSKVTEDNKSNETKLSEKEAQLTAAKNEVTAVTAEMKNAGGENKTLNDKLTKIENDLEKKGNEEVTVSSDLGTAKAKEDGIAGDLARLEDEINNAEFEIKDAAFDLEEFKKANGNVADISELKKRLLQIQSDEANMEKMEKDLKSAYDRISGEYNRLLAEKSYSDRATGDEAVRAILKMRDTGAIKGVYGTVNELATAEKDFELALAVAAGGKMKAIIVENDAVAAEGIAALKKSGLGRAIFLPLNKMLEGKPRAKAIMIEKQTLGYAIDLIDFNPKFRAAFWYVFADTLVVKDLDSARSLMGNVRLVTKGGELLEASGAMIGGNIKGATNLKFGSGTQGKLDEVAKQLDAARDSYENIQNKLEALRNEKRLLSNEVSNQGAGKIEVQNKLTEKNIRLKNIKEKKANMEKLQVEKKAEYDQAKSAREKLDAQLAVLKKTLDELKAEKEKIKQRILDIAPTGLSERMQNANALVDKLTGEITELRNIQYDAKNAIFSHETNCKNYGNNITENEGKIKTNEKEIAEKSELAGKFAQELESLRKIMEKMEAKTQELRDKKETIANNKIKAENSRDNAIKDIETKNGVRDSALAQIKVIEETISKLDAEIKEIKFEVDKPIPSEEELKRAIKKCEDGIEKLGAVNLRAIDDYQEKKGRYDILMEDLKKLNSEIEELDKFMEELAAKKKGLFMETYNGIAKSFKEIFYEISGGGEAYISLENEEDPFAGGLVLHAKPKGGKMLNLALLSGGEKSLTALAFIFAIQDCQPSPFYVFDEVDMFLDPINAEIVATYIKKSSTKSQFLQITHKPNVLPVSNHLVGVTKQANGISRVIMEPNIDDLIKADPDMQKEGE